jgi:hypothetical protein
MSPELTTASYGSAPPAEVAPIYNRDELVRIVQAPVARLGLAVFEPNANGGWVEKVEHRIAPSY